MKNHLRYFHTFPTNRPDRESNPGRQCDRPEVLKPLQFARKYKFTVYLHLVLGVVHVHTIEIDCIEICLAFISRFCYKHAEIIAYSKRELRLDIVLENAHYHSLGNFRRISVCVSQ